MGLGQCNPVVGDLEGNAQRILDLAKQGVPQGLQLLITPELSLCGYPPRDLLLEPYFVARAQAVLVQLAQDLPTQVGALVGTILPNPDWWQKGEKPLYNSVAYVQGGRIRQTFHKRLLPNYDVFDEERYFQSGPPNGVLRLAGLRLGITICEDLWNDSEFWSGRRYDLDPVADVANRGIDLLINLAASPYTQDKQKLRESLLGHCAKRYQVPLIYVNQVGGNDDLVFDGHSLVLDSSGDIVTRCPGFTEELRVVSLAAGRGWVEKPVPAPLDSSLAELWQALVTGIRDYVHKSGFQQALVGLSGGVDSALVAALATEALGAAQVLGVLMPSPHSSSGSVTDAQDLAGRLGMPTMTLGIEALMAAYEHTLSPVFTHKDLGVTAENIQARIRGNLLMALANQLGCLVLATGNKSELAVGYCTLYGDMCGALAPIADLWKTQVYELCTWRNQQRPAVFPAAILTKAPSAELRPGQTDQDTLPPYPTLDAILHRLLLDHQAPQQIVAAGFDAPTVAQVLTWVERAEFKRRQAPPVLKVSERAFGIGWRLPVAAQRGWEIVEPAP